MMAAPSMIVGGPSAMGSVRSSRDQRTVILAPNWKQVPIKSAE